MKITIVAGARPNFMKIAPIMHALKLHNNTSSNKLEFSLVHTGQHFDEKMSETFFRELNIPHPDVNLSGGGGSQAEQTAAIMVAFEKYLIENPCDLVLVVGDVTSTLACSIVAKKLQIKVAHVEAGIRSFDMSMPEEINRMVTDSITDFFFTTTTWAGQNLIKSGVKEDKIYFTGNVMIDTLNKNLPNLREPKIWQEASLQKENYLMITLHRPSNVDDVLQLKGLMEAILKYSENLKLIFPVHPRTRKVLSQIELNTDRLYLIEPLGYLEFNYLVKNAKGVVTDSGGITEETTVLGIPCITLRTSTERPETVEIGTNELIGNNPETLKPYLEKLLSGNWKQGGIPEKWDGNAAERIVEILSTIDLL
jgi:UDP-N-acetylglucosamine 2-epimerase (non-hydrolysing)